MIDLFLKLLLAHLLGDFFLQSKKAVTAKEYRKIASPYLYCHCILHVILVLITTWNIYFWPYALAIGLSHLLIDLAKLYLQDKRRIVASFLIDQFLHIIVLVAVAVFYTNSSLSISFFTNSSFLLLLICILFLTSPCSIFIKIAISNWSPQNLAETSANGSLQNAGKWIGHLERLLIFLFIVIGKFEAIGFLLAAKSIFRFGDLKQGEDRRLTEYVLIGTLLSFGLAILVGIVYTYINQSSLQ